MTIEEFKIFTPETSALLAKVNEDFREKRKPIEAFTEDYKKVMLARRPSSLRDKLKDLEYTEEYLKKWCDLLIWQNAAFVDIIVAQEVRYLNLHEGQSKRPS